VKEEFKKIGIAYKFLRSTRENDWYPHYVHNLDNLMRYGGCFRPSTCRRRPAHPAHRDDACLRRRLHAGARPGPDLPDEGPEGQEDRPVEEPERHQKRLVARPGGTGIELMLMLNDMTRDDVQIVEFPYPDDWYDKPEMLTRWRTRRSCG